MRRKKEPLILQDVEIVEIGAEGNSIAKIDNKILFVPSAIPGDIVDVQIIKNKKNYFEGRIISIKHKSKIRIEPVCAHFGLCGGCKWQHLPYEEQLKWKEKQVIENIKRIGKISSIKVNPIIPSPDVYYYRNKLEYTFSDNKWLTKQQIESPNYYKEPGAGFHVPNMFDKIIDIDKCYLQDDFSNTVRNSLKNFLIKNKLPFFDLRTKKGLIGNLIIRNTLCGEWMVIVVFGTNEEKEKQLMIMDYLKNNFPQINSLNYIINTKLNDSINDLDVFCYLGKPYIIEEIDNLKFRIGPKSFFQTNSKQALAMYKIVRQMAHVDENSIVYDLYTGTGTIANFVAPFVKKVIGIEYVPEAINDANINSAFNNITNTTFIVGDVKEVINAEFINNHGHPDVVITDPPRSGMHPSVVKKIIEILPKRIVYVSCNPATQARDLSLLSDKYIVEEMQPLDMFPHTHHIENIVKLALK